MQEMHMLSKDSAELSHAAAAHVSTIIKRAVMIAQDGDGGGHAVAIGATLSGIEVIASLFGNPYENGIDGDVAVENALTNQSSLFAALVVGASVMVKPTGKPCHCGNPEPHNGIDFGVNFGPHALFQAAQWYETLKGEKPDRYLNPGLAGALEEMRQDPVLLHQQVQVLQANEQRPN